MSITLYQVSIPMLIHGLNTLSSLLEKAEQHAQAQQIDHQQLLSARLYEDMLPLIGQVQRASDTAKASASRLSSVAAPAFADEEASFDDLQARINKTIVFLEAIPADAINGQEERAVTLKLRGEECTMTAQQYLTDFGLPNFLFHVTTAYAILRNQGVKLGKMDFLNL
ncbi:hypothetical protein Hrubri_0288 [Herbaspirillum rubrisubalbicans M1]|uniref:DUF1993 domain-containing protein n=1 Tax=Herbaspirillum rubrisubalbicans TaxID=80842 RepID=UPI00073A0826|nr:DUF1993 domain-containing protein [Herbaspirillum rubrisubalbicans]ALU87517.1 hypothetical protein Hrubri_0288 [Herbaspirillum rubrisubalbicans M1]